jgi:hypothetical protein
MNNCNLHIVSTLKLGDVYMQYYWREHKYILRQYIPTMPIGSIETSEPDSGSIVWGYYVL